MRDVLNKFPKVVLINYMIKHFWFNLGKTATRLEADLLWIQWEVESKEAVDAMLKYSDEAKAHRLNGDMDRMYQARSEWEKALARSERADKILERYQKLVGF